MTLIQTLINQPPQSVRPSQLAQLLTQGRLSREDAWTVVDSRRSETFTVVPKGASAMMRAPVRSGFKRFCVAN